MSVNSGFDNIYGRFDNISEVKSYIMKLNETKDWKSSNLFVENVQFFIEKHLDILANQTDAELYKQLIELSDRVNLEWDRPDAHDLAFKIIGIAKGVLKDPTVPWTNLPRDAWKEILSHIPPRNVLDKSKKTPSGLESFRPSKNLQKLASEVKKEWIGRELISLKNYGCTTAKSAVEYAIKHQLKGAHLSDFPDLEESDLEHLFKSCPQLDQLIIESDKIINLPSEASKLKALYCYNCLNLQSLPKELPKVVRLECINCPNLQSLPEELPNVLYLYCNDCMNLQSLPKELPKVLKLYCNDCTNLKSLPEKLPKMLKLKCYNCPNLQSLPEELPQVLKLACSNCPKLQSLPEKLPKVERLSCSYCQNLQSLPEELPKVVRLDCTACPLLQNLPALPRGARCDCDERLRPHKLG